jgi:hypothetical protein
VFSADCSKNRQIVELELEGIVYAP